MMIRNEVKRKYNSNKTVPLTASSSLLYRETLLLLLLFTDFANISPYQSSTHHHFQSSLGFNSIETTKRLRSLDL